MLSQAVVYKLLVTAEKASAKDYMLGRLAFRTEAADIVFDNVQGMPRSMPQAHRWAMFKVLLNAMPTGRRYRFLGHRAAGACVFCTAGEDSLEHYATCSYFWAFVQDRPPNGLGLFCLTAVL